MTDSIDLPQGILDAMTAGALGDPFAVLGPHRAGAGWIARMFLPDAHHLALLTDEASVVECVRIHPSGLFEARFPIGSPVPYRLRATFATGTVELHDPYRFGPVLGELDIYLFSEGTHIRAHEKLGAHPMVRDGVAGTGFAVWAPTAQSVSVVGSFNNWDGRRHPMRRHATAGLWDIFLPGVGPGDAYKFQIHAADGTLLPLKADPYAARMELRPGTASIVAAPSAHVWQDEAWMEARAARNDRAAPISIYEVHLGSWRRRPEEGDRFLTYRELADELVPYVAYMGFTHIEMLPIAEFPFDGSWGYQSIGLFAPTSRFGTPDDFRYFVDACHAAGIAVWLDWVPGHFPTDAHGLASFDGTHLYEHADPRQGYQPDWNTLVFNYGRPEVVNYLLANALSWLENFHIDGLRVDAVASMLYLDFSREPGQWVPNKYGGRENLDAIVFLRRMNELVFGEAPGATTAAEESTWWPRVSAPTYLGGLGFGFKWNLGWMHDTLDYMKTDPIYRKYRQRLLTFGIMYQFSENFILPLSHDEVVHLKRSILGRMPGDEWQRFANLRAYYGFFWTHPGKKLLFMGGEFGQYAEWNYDRSLDWHLTHYPLHAGIQRVVRDLNHLYRDVPALHALDCLSEGFLWIDADDSDQSCVSYLRFGKEPGEVAVIVCNFTPVVRRGYRVGVPLPGFYRERLNTDASEYGGSGIGNLGGVATLDLSWHGRDHALSLTLPPLATIILTLDEPVAEPHVSPDASPL